MAGFSASESAFSGFRLIRERPKAVLWWTAFVVLVEALGFLVMFAFAGGSLQVLEAAMEPHSSLAEVQAMFRAIGPAYLVLAPVVLIYSSMLAAAVARTFLSPQALPFGGLRLGWAELRTLGAMLLAALTVLGVAIGALLLAVFLIGLTGAVHAPPAVIAARVVGLLLAIAVILFVAVRLSLTIAATVAEGRIGLGRSWRLTRGHVWPLLGCYVLTAVFAMILALVVFVAMLALAAATNAGAGLEAVMRIAARWPAPGSTAAAWIVWLFIRIVWSGLSAVVHALWGGPTVAAYKAFCAQDVVAVF